MSRPHQHALGSLGSSSTLVSLAIAYLGVGLAGCAGALAGWRYDIPKIDETAAPSREVVTQLELAKNLTLVTVERRLLPLVVIEFGWARGRLDDPKDRSGLAVLFGVAWAYGRCGRGGERLADSFAPMGGSFAVMTDRDSSTVRLEVSEDFLAPALERLAACLGQLELDELALETARASRIAALRRDAHDPETLAWLALEEEVYGTRVGAAGGASATTLTHITLADLDAELARMRQTRWVVALAGRITHMQAVELIARTLGAVPRLPANRVDSPANGDTAAVDAVAIGTSGTSALGLHVDGRDQLPVVFVPVPGLKEALVATSCLKQAATPQLDVLLASALDARVAYLQGKVFDDAYTVDHWRASSRAGERLWLQTKVMAKSALTALTGLRAPLYKIRAVAHDEDGLRALRHALLLDTDTSGASLAGLAQLAVRWALMRRPMDWNVRRRAAADAFSRDAFAAALQPDFLAGWHTALVGDPAILVPLLEQAKIAYVTWTPGDPRSLARDAAVASSTAGR